jgi:serine phosphatase RsbU (regulator of sigma subunit)
MTPARRIISLRWIITGAAIALTSASVIGVGVLAERNARRTLGQQLRTRVLLESRNLALTSSGALLSDFPELTLTPILVEMRDEQPELAFAVVVDHEGTIRGHADARRIGNHFALPGNLSASDAAVEASASEMIVSNAAMLVAAAPVRHPGGERIGTAFVAMSQAYIDDLLAESRRKQIVLVAVILVAGAVTSGLLVSVLLRPIGTLREGLERIGRGDLETPVRLKGRTELGLLAETMNEMAQRIREAQTERVEKERLAREVELARQIQSSLLPTGGLRVEDFVVDGAQQSAAEVGGDYYDILPLADGRIGLAIADVSGKGLGGCLVTSMLSALVRAFRDDERSPSGLLVRLERNLEGSLRPGTFITMFYGILDPRSRELTFASAGHSPLLVWRAATREVEWHKTTGIPIGAVRKGALARTLEDRTIRLEPADLAVQYTDGISEAFDPSGEHPFGFDRLAAATITAGPEGCRAVVDRIRGEVRNWSRDRPPDDDETLLVLGREAPPLAGGDPTRLFELARERGHHLPVPVDLGGLDRIRPWIGACPGLESLTPREVHVVELGLYEVCANIVEHGYGEDAAPGFDLWWVPDGTDGSRARGVFVLADKGRPFRPSGPPNVDFRDPAVRRRGRGFGLEIIHGAMSRVSYHPDTPAGNVTILGFDPEKIRSEEVSHG